MPSQHDAPSVCTFWYNEDDVSHFAARPSPPLDDDCIYFLAFLPDLLPHPLTRRAGHPLSEGVESLSRLSSMPTRGYLEYLLLSNYLYQSVFSGSITPYSY